MQRKRKLNIDEQIQYLLDKKGIKFEKCSKEEAINFLKESNYFFKIKSFAKNYKKDNNGKYINLDFAYLKEFALIDTLFRSIVLEFSLACEHLIKTKICANCSQNPNIDGYTVVDDYLVLALPEALKRYEKSSKKKTYQNELISHYYNYSENENKWLSDFAVWNFVEILSFSELQRFYKYYCKEYNIRASVNRNLLFCTIKIRNAAAHNSCILHDFVNSRLSNFKYTRELQNCIRQLNIKQNNLNFISSPVINDFLCLVFLFNSLCSKKMKEKFHEKLSIFYERCERKCNYFKNNYEISS